MQQAVGHATDGRLAFRLYPGNNAAREVVSAATGPSVSLAHHSYALGSNAWWQRQINLGVGFCVVAGLLWRSPALIERRGLATLPLPSTPEFGCSGQTVVQ